MSVFRAVRSHIETWKTSGSYQQLLDYATPILNTPNSDLTHPIGYVVQCVLRAGLAVTIAPKDVAAFLAALMAAKSSDCEIELDTIILNYVWIFEQEIDTNDSRRGQLVNLAQALVAQKFLSTDNMKIIWDYEFLEAVKLISSAKMFRRKVIRVNTNLQYKQQKFNLLREASEGFSKVVTELSTQTQDRPNHEDTAKRAATVLKNIMALTGYFNLDPNRVLDLTLEVFASNIVTHYQFFIELFRQSPWVAGKTDVCAQILGFRFQGFQREENWGKDASSTYMVAALLIAHGIVDLEALYPHLAPEDEKVLSEFQDFRKSMIAEAKSFKNNALSMAGALSDETTATTPTAPSEEPSAATPTAEPENTLTMPNQKLGLVNALLTIGAVERATFILMSFPNATASHQRTADLLSRIVQCAIDPLYEPFNPVALHPVIQRNASFPFKYPGKNADDLEVVRSISPFVPNANATTRYEFFYPRWQDETLKTLSCANLDVFYDDVFPLLRLIGPRVHRDPILVAKLCRIGAGYLSRLSKEVADIEKNKSVYNQELMQLDKKIDEGMATPEDEVQRETLQAKLDTVQTQLEGPEAQLEDVKKHWIWMCQNLFLPAISLNKSNTGMVHEVWQVIKQLPYQTRFAMYGDWKEEASRRSPELLVAVASTEKEAKSVMRRINKEDVKQYGRMFAKLAHSNPLVVFAAAMRQLEGGYDNMILPLVDACKYLTDFGYDVLGYALLESISNTMRSKVHDDGITISKWMTTLCSFAANLYRKYPNGELGALLQYIVLQLHRSHPHDLLLLRELMSKMGGVEETTNLNPAQMLAMAGGETLKNETMTGGVTGTVMKKSMRSCLRLQEAMMKKETASKLLVLIARHRQKCIFQDPLIFYIKVLSNLFDQAHMTLVQFLDFLTTNLGKEYANIVPSLTRLCDDYKLMPSVAMWLARPKIQDLVRKEQKRIAMAKAETAKKASSEQPNGPSSNAMEVDQVVNDGSRNTNSANVSTENSPWLPCLEPMVEEIKPLLPARCWRSMIPQFYILFWQLNLYDIYIPKDQYDSRIKKLQETVGAMDNDKRVYSAQEKNKRAKERERLVHTAARLSIEQDNQLDNHKRVLERLEREKNYWFVDPDFDRNEVALTVFQFCVFPRACFSGQDAIYCAKLVFLLHSIATPGFSTLLYLDKLFMGHERVIPFLSESEAKNFGKYLCEVLSQLAIWHENKALFEQEARGSFLPGFQRKWPQRAASSGGPGTTIGAGGSEPITADLMLEYEDFRHALYKWHSRLYIQLRKNLESKEHILIKNSILLLREISTVFPKVTAIGTRLEEAVQNVADKEDREDIKLMANAYLGILKKQRDTGMWIPKDKFHHTEDSGSSSGQQASATSKSGGTTSAGRSDSSRGGDAKSSGRTSSSADDRDDRDKHGSSSSTSNTARDRLSSVKDSRGGSSSPSPTTPGRKLVPLPPKPGSGYDNRHEPSSSNSNRDQPSSSRDQRDRPSSRDMGGAAGSGSLRNESTSSSTGGGGAGGDLLVISLKGSSSGNNTGNSNVNSSTGGSSGRDTPTSREGSSGNRPSLNAPPDPRGDRRDISNNMNSSNSAKDLAAMRQELRNSAPRDPRDRGGDISSSTPNLDRNSNTSVNSSNSRSDSQHEHHHRDSRSVTSTSLSSTRGDGRDSRDMRDGRDGGREPRDGRDSRDGRDRRDGRDSRDGRGAAFSSNNPPPRDPRDISRDQRGVGGAASLTDDIPKGPAGWKDPSVMSSSDRDKDRSLRDKDVGNSSGRNGREDESRSRASVESSSRDVDKDKEKDKDKERDRDRESSRSERGDRDRDRGDRTGETTGGDKDQEKSSKDRSDRSDRRRDRSARDASKERRSSRERSSSDRRNRDKDRGGDDRSRSSPSRSGRGGDGGGSRDESSSSRGRGSSKRSSSSSRNERSSRSRERKRGRESRHQSPDRDHGSPKRRREGDAAEGEGDRDRERDNRERDRDRDRDRERAPGSPRKRPIQPDMDLTPESSLQARGDRERHGVSKTTSSSAAGSSSPLARDADTRAMPPPPRKDASPAISSSVSGSQSSSPSAATAGPNAVPAGSTKRIKLNRSSDSDIASPLLRTSSYTSSLSPSSSPAVTSGGAAVAPGSPSSSSTAASTSGTSNDRGGDTGRDAGRDGGGGRDNSRSVDRDRDSRGGSNNSRSRGTGANDIDIPTEGLSTRNLRTSRSGSSSDVRSSSSFNEGGGSGSGSGSGGRREGSSGGGGGGGGGGSSSGRRRHGRR